MVLFWSLNDKWYLKKGVFQKGITCSPVSGQKRLFFFFFSEKYHAANKKCNTAFSWKLANKNLPAFLSKPTISAYNCSRLTLLLISGNMLVHSAFTADRQSKQSTIRNSRKLSLHPNSNRNKSDQVSRSDGDRWLQSRWVIRSEKPPPSRFYAHGVSALSSRRRLERDASCWRGSLRLRQGGSTCSGFCRWQLGLSRYRFVLFYPGAVIHLRLLHCVTDAF